MVAIRPADGRIVCVRKSSQSDRPFSSLKAQSPHIRWRRSTSSDDLCKCKDEHRCSCVVQVQHLAQQVADLQDEAEGREDAHNERVAALQATVERLSAEAGQESDERIRELEANIQVLEQQVQQIPY